MTTRTKTWVDAPSQPNFVPPPGAVDEARYGTVDTTPGSFDGNAPADIPNGDAARTEPGPHYVNAGSYFYDLDVISLSITQHF